MDLAVAFKLTVLDKASAGLRSASATLGKMAESAKATGESWKKAGETLTQAGQKVSAVSQQLQAGIGSILAPANEVQTAMAELAASFPTVSATMTTSMGRIQASAIAWSQEHTQSAAQYVQTSKMLMAAGVSEANVVEATNSALRLQTAVGGDAAQVARTLGVIYQQMGDKTKPANAELARLGDVLTRTKQLFPTIDVAALTDPLKDATPAAKAAGVSFEQLAATLGQLNAAGLQGGEAGAKLAAVMATLGPGATKVGVALKKTSSGGLDMVATLAEIEKKFGSVDKMTPEVRAKLEAAFGPEAFKTMSLLLGQTGKLSDAYGKITDSSGAAANAQKILESTTAAQAKIAEQQLDALKIEIAAGLAPALAELLPMVRDGIQAIMGFAKAHPEIVKTAGKIAIVVAAITAIVGPALMAAGALVSFAGFMMAVVVPALIAATSGALAFAAAMLANPITWIVLAIVAAAILLYVYWEPISEFFIGLWAKISSAFNAAANVMRQVWSAARGAVVSVFTDIQAAFQKSFVGGVMTAMALLNPGVILGRVFAAVRPILARVWFDVRTDIYAFFDSTRAELLAWWQGLINDLHGVGDSIRAGLRVAWQGVKSDAAAAFLAIAAWFKATFVAGIQSDLASVLAVLSSFSLRDAGANIVKTLYEGMKASANLPAEAMAAITQQVRNYLPFSPAKEGAFRDLHRVKLVETVADSINAAPLVTAMSGAAGLAMAAFSSAAAPAALPVSPSIPAAPGAAGAPAAGGSMQITINLTGGTDGGVSELETWLRNPTNTSRLAAALDRERARGERASFG